MTTTNLLLTVILFCSVLLSSHADHDDILTDDDVRAFEEAVAERHPEGAFSILMGETKLLEKRQSSRIRKVNSARGQLQQSNRKRGRQRSLLRRSGIDPTLTSNRRRVLKKRKRRPSTRTEDGGRETRRRLTQTRILGKSEAVPTERPPEVEEKNIEKAILQALEDATTTKPTTKEMSPLRMTPPRRGDSFLRSSTPPTIEEAVTAPLDDLIAALEGIEAPTFLDAPTTGGTTQGTPTLTTTEIPNVDTTTETKTTIEALLLVRSTSEAVDETTPLPPSRQRPAEVPSIDEEAQKLSDEIEKNFIENSVIERPKEETPPPHLEETPVTPPLVEETPAPPHSEETPAPPPHSEETPTLPPPEEREAAPPSPPPRRAEPSPPGEQPPSDSVVSELNTADDFLAVAKRLRLFRRRQTQL